MSAISGAIRHLATRALSGRVPHICQNVTRQVPSRSTGVALNFARRSLATSRALLQADVQEPAPDFWGTAVINGEFRDIKLSDYKGKYLVLLFYPLDFTFVCPTEIIAFSQKANEFRDVNTQVIGVSVDSKFCHLAWMNTPKKEGGVGPLNIPLLSDLNKDISRDYGVLLENDGVALRRLGGMKLGGYAVIDARLVQEDFPLCSRLDRDGIIRHKNSVISCGGLFLIDPDGIIRHKGINDLPVGRSVEEVLRLVKAFQFVETHGEVCPANWQPNSETIKPDPVGSKEYFGKVN